MLAHSGVLVSPQNNEVPSITDIARSLGRISRFGGQYRVTWWTVLHHSLCAYRLAKRLGQKPKTQLLALLHDWHESVTGDIPSWWKTEDMELRQEELDRRFFEHHGFEFSAEDREAVKAIDRLLLHAEGFTVGPPEWGKAIYQHVDPDVDACNVVMGVLAKYYRPMSTLEQPLGPAQMEFLDAYHSLTVPLVLSR